VNQQQKKNFLTVDASTSLLPLLPFFSCFSPLGGRWRRADTDVDAETPTSVIEAAFQEFTERPDIAILLINQHVSLSTLLSSYHLPSLLPSLALLLYLPALEVPS
jgi:hypothetical protein